MLGTLQGSGARHTQDGSEERGCAGDQAEEEVSVFLGYPWAWQGCRTFSAESKFCWSTVCKSQRTSLIFLITYVPETGGAHSWAISVAITNASELPRSGSWCTESSYQKWHWIAFQVKQTNKLRSLPFLVSIFLPGVEVHFSLTRERVDGPKSTFILYRHQGNS